MKNFKFTSNFCHLNDIVDSEDFDILPAEVSSEADETWSNILSAKSKERYKINFNCLKEWMSKKSVNTIIESMLMKWFIF